MALYHLGLSTSGHDPALALVDAQGRLVFAEATERFLQDKRAWGIAPDHVNHLLSALQQVGFDLASDTLTVATTWKKAKAELPVQITGDLLPASDALWLRELQAGLHARAGASLLRLGLARDMPEVRRYDHHLCHAITACGFAPAQSAACLIIDGEGEAGAVSFYNLRDRRLTRQWRSWGPGSLGTLYAWLTQLCGFDWRLGEEWKVMGLAAYGTVQPQIRDLLLSLLTAENGRLRFADRDRLLEIAGKISVFARSGDAPLMDAADLAASGQAAYAALADRILDTCNEGSEGNLILGGGCALNSSYNGTIVGHTKFERLFVPPAPADDGNAVGAALLSWMQTTGIDKVPVLPAVPYLGSAASASSVAKIGNMHGLAQVSDISGTSETRVAQLLAQGKIIGVMRGRAEFGPRALGNRSILADPRAPDMKDRINRLVKGREPYRPFAPVLCVEDVGDWFENAQPSPYMSITLRWRRDRALLVPAVVHQDGTGRLQTVDTETTPWMHGLVRAFEQETGVPVILNTSFNIMGSPMVHKVEDALAAFATTGLDALVIEDMLIEKYKA
ncbi:carbamoyltransferase family protein [Meridianimarinicoccus aquatilis]|uniref:Carbamoyl transferase n=1 Tax=Meridianimarinicoccus aquatilis TaxID=2552766 RepID=A0A4R6B1B5_9RHOB|nr:carbamoyltransferase C-terminal domain-containing protein [Fluviibacterium aquatile]TDL88998.1 carbamoyl transferase [Fluviibacterium aquatile]